MPTMPRPMRIPDDVWFPALDRARGEGRTLTSVTTDFLRAYGAGEVEAPAGHPQPTKQQERSDG